MRRKVGIFLTALGAFLVVTGLLVRFYAYPALAKVPLDQNSITRLEAKDATVFSISELKPVQTSLHVEATTVGDVKAADAEGNDVAIWAGTTTVKDGDGTIVSQSKSLSAFDRVSAQGVDCCDSFNEDTEAGVRTPVDRSSGLVYKFPFNAEKKTYKVFDDQARQSYDAVYKGEDDIQGVKVYVYEQKVPRQQVGEREVPSSVLGLPGKDRAVTAGQYYTNTRTFYIEPNTGAPVDRVEEQYQTLTWKGEDKVTATKATVRMTADQVKEYVDTVGSQGPMLGMIRNVVPWVLAILGVLLAAGGIFLRNGATAGGHRAKDEDQAAGAA